MLQNVPGDTYRTDLFQPYVKKVESLSGKPYGADPQTDRSIRIVVEHARAAAFLIADGIQPSNEWRGYVLRRLIRRAALHARRLGLKTGAIAMLGRVSARDVMPTLITSSRLLLVLSVGKPTRPEISAPL